jgi:hypothetical protein
MMKTLHDGGDHHRSLYDADHHRTLYDDGDHHRMMAKAMG